MSNVYRLDERTTGSSRKFPFSLRLVVKANIAHVLIAGSIVAAQWANPSTGFPSCGFCPPALNQRCNPLTQQGFCGFGQDAFRVLDIAAIAPELVDLEGRIHLPRL